MIILFILGSASGSFISCLAYRFIHNKSIYKGRSQCEYCQQTLHWYDLIPVISYILLKGTCRYCHHKIRILNLISELLIGILFVLNYKVYGIRMWVIDYICIVLLFIAIVDYYTCDVYLISLIYLSIGILLYKIPSLSNILYSIIFILPLLATNLLYKDSLGLGDIQLLFLLSLMNTLYINILLLFIASFIALLHVFIYKKKNIIKIPFVPYIVLSTYLIMLF